MHASFYPLRVQWPLKCRQACSNVWNARRDSHTHTNEFPMPKWKKNDAAEGENTQWKGMNQDRFLHSQFLWSLCCSCFCSISNVFYHIRMGCDSRFNAVHSMLWLPPFQFWWNTTNSSLKNIPIIYIIVSYYTCDMNIEVVRRWQLQHAIFFHFFSWIWFSIIFYLCATFVGNCCFVCYLF